MDRKLILLVIVLSGLAALGAEGPAGAYTWSVKGDGEVVCTVEGVAFRALPADCGRCRADQSGREAGGRVVDTGPRREDAPG